MPSKARVVKTSCDSCGAKLVVRVQVVAKGRGKRNQETDEKAIREEVVNEVRKALGLRKKRKDAGKPKPKRKASAPKEEPQAQSKKAKRQRRKAGAVGTMRALVRNCGCKLTGRHKKTCHLAKANYDAVAAAKAEKPGTYTPKGSEVRRSLLAQADKAEDRQGGPKKRLSDKGRAAIGALDPVAKPIKAGG